MIRFDDFRQHAEHDLVGVTPMSCFDHLPPSQHPQRIFPDTCSVVVLGSRIRRGQFRSMEEGSLWKTPARWLTQFDGVVRFIETQGYECVPYAPVNTPRMPRRAVREGLYPPNQVRVAIDYAAAAAGLGEIGMHGLFMSPEFGVRQSLGLLVTDMPIEPGPGATPAVCDHCMACVRACPLNAISTEDPVDMPANGRTMTVGRINAAACRACPNGTSGDSAFFAGAEELHVDIENNQIKGDVQRRYAATGLPNRLAAPCSRACIAHFEDTHNTGYTLPFRIREPWGFRPDERKES